MQPTRRFSLDLKWRQADTKPVAGDEALEEGMRNFSIKPKPASHPSILSILSPRSARKESPRRLSIPEHIDSLHDLLSGKNPSGIQKLLQDFSELVTGDQKPLDCR